eukprot:g7083.t1
MSKMSGIQRTDTEFERLGTEKRIDAYDTFGVVAALMAGFALQMADASFQNRSNIFSNLASVCFTVVSGTTFVAIIAFTMQYNYAYRLYAESSCLSEDFMTKTESYRHKLTQMVFYSIFTFVMGNCLYILSQLEDFNGVSIRPWDVYASVTVAFICLCVSFQYYFKYEKTYMRISYKHILFDMDDGGTVRRQTVPVDDIYSYDVDDDKLDGDLKEKFLEESLRDEDFKEKVEEFVSGKNSSKD